MCHMSIFLKTRNVRKDLVKQLFTMTAILDVLKRLYRMSECPHEGVVLDHLRYNTAGSSF